MANVSFNVTYELRRFFFDRQAVIARLEEAEARELSKIGAFLRTTAQRRFLRRRKRTSAPGEAPSVHSTDRVANLRNILFGYDPRSHGVVVGPVKLNQINTTIDMGNQTVPQILEFGGAVMIREERYRGKTQWFRQDLRISPSPYKEYRQRIATYAARPFMRKALDWEIARGTIRNQWRAAISS